jgi:hypothetical protein
MDQVLTYIKLWPIVVAVFGIYIAIVIAVRYKLPDLTRRIEALEKKGAKSTDLTTAIDGFRTVCKFNQVSCQKEMQHKWGLLQKEVDEKLGLIHEKMNAIAITNAKVITKLDILLKDRQNGNGNNINHFTGGK